MAPAAQRAELDPLRLSGIVQSSGGSLLAGAHVCLLRGPALGGGASACVRSDAAGRFTLESLPDGEWPTLSASADGYLSLRQTLAADRQTPLVLRLEPGGVRVSGTVLDAAGGPISGALVSAGRAGEQGSALVLTSNTGKFAMTVPAGTTRLWARAEGYSQLAREVEAPAQQVQLLLSAASFLRGHVLVEATRQPAAGVDVTVLDAGGTGIEARSATTDEHGRFQLEELPAGAYSVGARSEGWRSAERLLVLETADEQDLELLVRPASRLRGSVRAGAAICNRGVVTLEGPVASTQAVDARGSVEFTALLPGEYRVVVSCDLGMTLSETIVIGAEPVTRDWELEPGLSVTGMATTFAGAPLAGAQIEIQPLGEPRTRERVVCRSDAQGAFACFGLQAGEY